MVIIGYSASVLYELKKFIPTGWLRAYHYFLARLADVWYGHPSRQLIVIGVTGTNGKTTTTYLIAKALEASGYATGCTSTALIKIGEREELNMTKMTMPGRFFLQKTLRRMVRSGCRYAVIETSSQGLIQHRHLGVAYDAAAFTNLTPEHIEAHGGFENYQRAKRMLFEHLARLPSKILDGQTVPRAVILNAESEHAEYFAQASGTAQRLWYGIDHPADVQARDLKLSADGSAFSVNGASVELRLPGRYNVENALAAFAVCQVLQIDLRAAADKIASVARVPGRFERVEAGQPWSVIVDYAPEPASLARLYEALALLPHGRIIHVLGSCGGGRDAARRPLLGQFAGMHADIVIVTNEDPYDDDPLLIIHQVADGAREAGKIIGQSLYEIADRREAVFKAMALAEPNDLVLLTGKGCEPWICLADGYKQPWNECETAKEAISAALAQRVSVLNAEVTVSTAERATAV